jgi:hypothetical protein
MLEHTWVLSPVPIFPILLPPRSAVEVKDGLGDAARA